VNDAESWAMRGQLLMDVPMTEGAMSWLLNLHGGRNESQATQFQQRAFRPSSADVDAPKIPGLDATLYADTDDSPFKGDYNTGDDENLKLFGASLHGTWEVSDVHSIESISGYEWHDRKTLENTDANPRNLLTTSYDDSAWQFSQDLMLHSAWSDTFETTVGFFYFREDLDVDNEFEDRTRFILQTEYTQGIRSVAVYGETEWEFWPDFVLDGSFRYTQEYKKFDNFSTAQTSAGNAGVGLNVGKDDATFSGTSGHIGLTWNFGENDLLYAKFTRGWKPGHFNGGSVFSAQIIEPVKPEKILAGEIGVKGSFFDDRLGVELAGFIYDYSDLQIFALEQDAGSFPLPQLINAQGAEILGVEVQLTLEPVEHLAIALNAAFLETEYTEFTNTLFRVPPRPPGQVPTDPVPVPITYTGNQMIGAPRWAVNGSIQYTFGLSRLGELVPRFSFSWKDDTFFDAAEGRGTLIDLPKGTIGQDAYAIFNASLGWKSPEDRLSITAWIRNLANEEARVQSFDVTDGFFFVIDAYRAPRTFGITLGFNY
jgi:iron complex outermembrane receptor protein